MLREGKQAKTEAEFATNTESEKKGKGGTKKRPPRVCLQGNRMPIVGDGNGSRWSPASHTSRTGLPREGDRSLGKGVAEARKQGKEGQPMRRRNHFP